MGGIISGPKWLFKKIRDARKTYTETIRPVVLNPIFATGVTLLIILAGGLFGLYADEIKSAWPIKFHARGRISWPAFWSWMFALVASYGFFERQRADDAKRDEAQRELIRLALDLEELVRTSPPAKFLGSFAQLHDSSDRMVGAVLATPPFDRGQVGEAVRVILRGVASLAQVFDGDQRGIRYASNVMVYKASNSLTETEKQEIIGRLNFCEEGVRVEGLDGVLDLDPELSGSTDSTTSPDTTMQPFALPVPATHLVDGRYKVLPGAPLALVTGEADIHVDFDRMLEWCDKHGSYSPSIRAKLAKYLQDARPHMQSFVSIPLLTRDEQPKAVGVLNIHCQRPGMLHAHPSAVAQFVAVMRPLQPLLVKLISARQAAETVPDVKAA